MMIGMKGSTGVGVSMPTSCPAQPPSATGATIPYAVATDSDMGRAALERSFPVHLELVEETFSRHLEPGEAEAVLRLAAKVCEAHGWPAKTPAD